MGLSDGTVIDQVDQIPEPVFEPGVVVNCFVGCCSRSAHNDAQCVAKVIRHRTINGCRGPAAAIYVYVGHDQRGRLFRREDVVDG